MQISVLLSVLLHGIHYYPRTQNQEGYCEKSYCPGVCDGELSGQQGVDLVNCVLARRISAVIRSEGFKSLNCSMISRVDTY